MPRKTRKRPAPGPKMSEDEASTSPEPMEDVQEAEESKETQHAESGPKETKVHEMQTEEGDGAANNKKAKIDEPPTRPEASPIKKLPPARMYTEASAAQLFQRKDLRGLTSMSQSLARRSEKTFQDYKRLCERRNRASETIIAKLTRENAALKGTVRGLKQENDSSETGRSAELYEQIEVLKQEKKDVDMQLRQLSKEMDLADSKQEIVELLTGAVCVAYEETEANIVFRLKQTGKDCVLFYELMLSKTAVEEMVYIPLLERPAEWDEETPWETNIEAAKKVLPGYLQLNLTFPSNTLRNFYAKLSRCLS